MHLSGKAHEVPEGNTDPTGKWAKGSSHDILEKKLASLSLCPENFE